MMRFFYIGVVLLLLNGCAVAVTNYDYYIKDGGYVDLKKGRYILNRPLTSNDRVEEVLYRDFKRILGDSLYLLRDLRKQHTLASRYPFDLAPEDMDKLKKITGCDYLISVKARSERKNTSVHENRATVRMRIYDLNNKMLVSDVVGTAFNSIHDSRNADEDYIPTFSNGASAIMLNALSGLIRKYRKQKI